MPELNHHGLKIIDSMHAELRFGITELVERRQFSAWIGVDYLSKDQKVALKRFNNRDYLQCCSKLRDTSLKIVHALNCLSNSLLIMENRDQYAYDGAPMEHAATYFSAVSEAPYHLDAYIAYLKIFADCLSFAIPFFYVKAKGIKNKSFRDHKSWFLKTSPTFDSEYSNILQSHTKWFDLLAGKEDAIKGGIKGIRDVNFHQFGIYQFGSRPLPNGQHQILISHVTGKGIQREDLLTTLEELTRDFFQFLELTHAHFAKLASKEIPQHSWNSVERSILMKFEMKDVRAKYRFFPLID